MKHARATLMTSFLCAAAGLGGCSTTAAPTPEIVDAPVAPPPPMPGVLDGPIGQRLSEKDRTAAIAAQHDAVSSGTRKTWRGDRGAYGFVTLGPVNGECREYTHRIFFNGRPAEAKGEACREHGEWRVKG